MVTEMQRIEDGEHYAAELDRTAAAYAEDAAQYEAVNEPPSESEIVETPEMEAAAAKEGEHYLAMEQKIEAAMAEEAEAYALA